MGYRVLVVGTVRDSTTNLKRTFKMLSRMIRSLGGSPSFFLVESDSRRATLKTLDNLKHRNANIEFQSLGNLAREIPDRVSRIAYCRNKYLEYLESQLTADNRFTHVVIADFDGVNTNVKYPKEPKLLFTETTVVCTNQRTRYYDILALRSNGWVNQDYRLDVLSGIHQGKDIASCYNAAAWSKQVHISPTSEPLSVASAFGGLAIYPSSLLSGSRYSPKKLNDGIHECEHISISQQVLRRGGSIQILPRLRNRGSWEHTVMASWLGRLFLALTPRALMDGFIRSRSKWLDEHLSLIKF